jgi:glutathione synthase/RimK-type ligase-like ATP-grasp enzyme
MPLRVALATCRDLPDLDPDERHTAAALVDRGVVVSTPVWDGPRALFAPSSCDLVIIRNTWDYTTQLSAFLAFVDDVAAMNRVYNDPAIIKSNTNKRYLAGLAAAGIATVPTAWLEQGDHVDFAAVRAMLPAAAAYIVKPVVGAGSRDTEKVDAADVARADALLARLLPRESLMVQPFLPRIADGEVSLIFVDGEFSHAVIKRPRTGDFRSQPEFGSHVAAYAPTAVERRLAEDALHCLGTPALLFARVDLVTGLTGAPVVIEVELTEPCLYLAASAQAAGRLADAIVRRA